jgi:hypothetical protein
MAHLRTKIRAALVTALTGLPTVGAHVYKSRLYPLEPDKLPALLIYSANESAEAKGRCVPRIVDKAYMVDVVAVARATADLDDVLDAVCEEVEIALATPCAPLEAALTANMALLRTTLEFDGAAEQPVGRARMTYRVDYRSPENEPSRTL